MKNGQTNTTLAESWKNDSRWKGIERTYRPEDVLRLRGSVRVEHTLARLGPSVSGASFMTTNVSPHSAR